jgi:hypothetical protein
VPYKWCDTGEVLLPSVLPSSENLSIETEKVRCGLSGREDYGEAAPEVGMTEELQAVYQKG